MCGACVHHYGCVVLMIHLPLSASSAHLKFRTLTSTESLRPLVGSAPYLLIEFDTGVRLVHQVGAKRTPGLFDFARNTIARLLSQPERADWKACAVSESGIT